MTEYLTLTVKNYVDSYTGLTKFCWESIFLAFIQATAIGICYFLSLYFVEALHLKVAVAGMILSFYGAGTVVGGIIGGKLSDKISPKLVSIVSLLIQSISFLFLSKIKTAELVMINLFFLGISVYGFKTANDVRMLDQCKGFPELRVKAVNISRVAMNLGLGLSGIIIGLYSDNGFENIFYLFSVLLFLASLYLAFQQRNDAIESHKKEQHSNNSQNESNSIIDRKVIIIVLICVFLVGLLIAQLGSTYPIYVKNAFPELGNKAVSILYILDTVLIVLFQAPLTNLLNNQNKIFIAGIGAFLMGIGMLLLSFSMVFSLAIISCIVWTTGEMLFMPMSQLICYEKSGLKNKGRSMGTYQAIYASSAIVGPALGGYIFQYQGGNDVWYVSAIVGVICLSLCYLIKSHD